MKCPACGLSDTRVIDSRLAKDGNAIRRRRECEKCSRRFTTYERVEDTLPLVVKKEGRRESFDRMKIAAGIQKALEKRPVSAEEQEALVDRIERAILDLGEKEVQSQIIGEKVMQKLHELDGVAYVRFASVYRSFKDVNQFMEEVRDLLVGQERKVHAGAEKEAVSPHNPPPPDA